MRVNLMTTTLALAIGVFLNVAATTAKAGETAVSCSGPVGFVNTGLDGTPPRFTIQCAGGSSAGSITYFAYRISTNANLAAMLVNTFQTYVLQSGGGTITISTDLTDVSGNAWGCSSSNCRVMDYLNTN
jgi:hypothetical protein